MSKLLALFVIFIQIVDSYGEAYRDRPKIKTSDGDLILESAFDKNIYLTPNGPKSSIYIGNINVLHTNWTKNSEEIVASSSIDIDRVLNGPNGILKRLELLENKNSTLPNGSSLELSALRRRINILNRKVIALETRMHLRERDECSSNPCQHGGTCLNLNDGYYCMCPPNWEGKNCDTDVNECRNFAGTDLGCQNGATCINRPGSYECLCRTGWFGLHCTRKAKDCLGGDFEMCGHGTCIPVQSGDGVQCICHQGWMNNGTEIACLTDVNECDASQVPRCSVNPRVECINLPGSFKCGPCPPGYEGDGYACHDIDECLTLPNGGCNLMVTCHNTIGSRICGPCPTGYVGDGVTCIRRSSCAINRGGCHPSAQCVDNLVYGTYGGRAVHCVCPEGMAGDGVGPLGCYNPISNSTQGCESNPCGLHGRCHSLRTGYICLCYRGYSGTNCDISVNTCFSNSCYHGGTCRLDESSPRGFRCECTAQYTGALCQIVIKRCGGVLDNEEGSLVYPMSNTTYDNNAKCAWVIHTSPEKVINVTFTRFNLEKEDNCNNDFLQIHDGRSSASQLLGRFCGNEFPKGGNIISSHNNLYFWFRSDSSVSKDGFALHWTSIKPFCGGEVDATTHGHISSPGSPGPYPPNRDCYWQLLTTLGKRIQLHFFELDIETHANCSFDYLAIYDGEHTTDPLLDRYCNSSQPAPIQSAGSDMLIHFHSDEYGSGKGFQISYAPIEGVPGCGGYYTAEQGELASPLVDDKYLNNLLCEYKIKTSPETKIKLDFKYFHLENSPRCKFDYLKIYDGPSADSKLIGKFCGHAYPKSYISSSNMLYFKFKTDHSASFGGFKIKYKSICRSYLRGDSGVVKSPGYPFRYPENKNCEYIISTTPGKAIQLTFQDFDLEESTYYNCTYDYIEIYDGQDSNSTLLGKYCGGTMRTPPVQTSTLNYMYIRFNSDMSVSGTGFYANYTTIETKCGGVYTDRTGLIQYPSENSESEHDQICTWLLVAPQGMHIKLNWNRFEIEHMPDCESDHVKLTEIETNNENTVLGTFCGNSLPPSITTFSNRLKIVFKSDSTVKSGGFSVSYTFLDEKTHCGGNFIRAHGFIYSPGWPEVYEPNKDCTWIINVPVGQQVMLNISEFDLERPIRYKCDLGDYLEIRNGATETSPLIGQFCGSFRNRRFISMANMLYLHFHSDFYLTGKGFKMEWDGTITGCGGTLTSSSGTITSPNYPNNYNENSECFYKIVTSLGSRIRITFGDLELENDIHCKNDYVEIFDGRDTSARSLGKNCFMNPSLHNIETSSNNVLIKFRSDFYLEHKGFMLTYNTLCHNNLTERYGVIESPDFPGNYPLHIDCLWTIKAPKGNKINVTFTNFDIYEPRTRRIYWSRRPFVKTCSLAYLQTKEISDVNFSDKLCGSTLPKPISSRSDSLQIRFVSGGFMSRSGFRLEWVTYGCGGHIQKSIGFISLDKTLASSEELECEWLIETPTGTSVDITFTELYMSNTPNCSLDAIELYNGQNSKAPLLTKACHRDTLSAQSTANFMFIRFVKSSQMKDVHFQASFNIQKATCGGYVNALSGYIYSQNYPKNYDDNINCIWTLIVPSNHRMMLNFIDVDLYYDDDFSNNENDCGDSIRIYENVNFVGSNYTYIICPKSNETEIITKTNRVLVQFTTNSLGRARGFKANFTAICGANLIALSDGIISNENSISHINSCVWTVQAPKLQRKVSLTITYIALGSKSEITNKTCPTSFLRVYDGDDINAPLIDEYCGNKIPPMIVSHGSAITIELGSYVTKITGHFAAHYSPLDNACGGTLTSEEGIIASPNYPLSYPPNADCEWILGTSPGNKVYIYFERLDIEYSDGCNEDYLEVRENNGIGAIRGVYCGSLIPYNTTAASKIYIKFHSNSENSGKGFVIHYEFLHGNDITGTNGVISSPLYPHSYQGYGEYTWRINTDWPHIIVITFENFEIQEHSDNCNNKLSIYDGFDETANLLANLCGILKDDQKTYQSSSNVMFIKLSLDETNTGSIFYLTWINNERNELVDNSGVTFNCGTNKTELILPGKYIQFQSPNYPDDYDNELNCQWIFRTLSGRHLSIVFLEFSIEDTNECFADSVSIYKADKPNDWTPLMKDICTSDNIKNKRLNASEYAKITFKSDNSVVRKGFQGIATSVCGGLVTNTSGIISAVWADMITYLTYSIKCTWTVKVRPGKLVRYNFIHFNISNTNDNCVTNVVLRNGESTQSPLLGRYCGYDHEDRGEKVTYGNALTITYTSINGMHTGVFKTFKLYYEEKNVECGSSAILNLDHQWEIINSPNYPSVPDAYTECVWIITAPPGEIIRIDFIDRFDLDDVDDCVNEVVEIRDGKSELSRSLGRFCSDRPGTIKTTNNVAYIKYMTQISEPRDGFKANVSIDICGGTIIANRGEVTSPSYPHMPTIPAGSVCEWRVVGGFRNIITIQPLDINLPESVSSCENKITIEEFIPSNNTNVELKTFCSENIETTFPIVDTSTNEVMIKLHIGRRSGWSQISEHRGFRFTFNTSRPICGGTISTSEGYLTTPSYPVETTQRYCQWLITAPDKNKRIRLEIIDSDTQKHRIGLFNDLYFQTAIGNTNDVERTRVFESSGNKMSIFVWLSSGQLRHRFKAKFSSDDLALCGGDITGITGNIKAPSINQSYTCEWRYIDETTPYNGTYKYSTILLNAKVNSNTHRNKCRYSDSKLVVQSFIYNNLVSIRRELCGITEQSLTIPSTSLTVKGFKTKTFSIDFDVSWKLQPCGGFVMIGDNFTNILNIPNGYNDTLDCVWIISFSTDSRVELKLDGSFVAECDDEYIKIQQGLSQNSPVIGDYCKGKGMETSLMANFKFLYVQYHSIVNPTKNVKLMARTVNEECGRYLTGFDRVFTSPNYPKSYSPNEECTWEIVADLGSRVLLEFIDRFLIEDTPNCTKDALIIYDWYDDKYVEKVRLCGRQAPPAIQSTNQKMKVVLRTDANTNLDGFKAQWSSTCGGKFIATEREQILYSPGYPYEYPPLTNCTYEIESSNNIKLKFLEFELEGSYPECTFDNVSINAYSNYNYYLEVYCGNKVPDQITAYNKIQITFKSDKYVQKKGFQIAYSIFNCGGNITNTTVLKSNPDSENYDSNLDCKWYIEAPPNMVIAIKFLYYDTESNSECYNDYISVFEGFDIDNTKRLALLCGHNNMTTVIRTKKNTALLQFVTDLTLTFRGFKAAIIFTYSDSVGCGGDIDLTTTSTYILKSPLINNKVVYENYLDCLWTIKSLPGTVIHVEFTQFHISSCEAVTNQTAIGFSKCDCDLVEVKDGLNPNSLIIGTYCGHVLPPQTVSSRNVMGIRLSTDGDLSSSGFEALITTKASLCGKTSYSISEQSQQIRSPGYVTGSIPRGLHCIYYLSASLDLYGTIHLTLDIDLSPETLDPSGVMRCNNDKILVISSPDSLNVTQGKDLILNSAGSDFFSSNYFYDINIRFPQRFEFCGSKKIDLYILGTTTINLLTSPDIGSSKYKGVDIQFKYSGFCGRNYTEPYGRIQSSYASRHDTSERSCFTLITAPENHTISLYFISVNPDYWNEQCYLEVFDGNNTKSNRLIKIQGSYENISPVFSSGRHLLIHNHENDDDKLSFDLNYVTTDKGSGCGGKLVSVVGRVTSPSYPNIYRHVSRCEWELETPVGTNLMLRFTVFDFGKACDQNYLMLVNRNGDVISTYCSESPADFTSQDNYVKIVYVTTRNNAGTGWVADFVGVI